MKSSRQFDGDVVGEIIRIKCYTTFKLCKIGEKICFFRMSKDRKEKERAFFENGSMVLEKLIAFCNGKSISIRSFSNEELKQATNNYDARLVIQ